MILRKCFFAVIIVVMMTMLVAASFSSTFPAAYAEEDSFGNVSVVLKSTSGTPIEGITVKLYSGDVPRYEGVTDSDGRAVISAKRQNYDMTYSVYLTLENTDVKTELNLRPGDNEASLTLYSVKYRDGEELLSHSSYMVKGGALKLKASSSLGLKYPQGKLFVGWKKDGLGDVVSDGAEVVIKSDTTYVAQWQDKKYEYVVAQSPSGYSLSEDGVIAPGNYFSNLSDLMTALETSRDNNLPCKITLRISEITYPLTLKHGTYNLYTYGALTVSSAFSSGAIRVEDGATINLYGKFRTSPDSLSDDDYSIAVDGGTLVLKDKAEADSVLILGNNDSEATSRVIADGYNRETEIGYRYDGTSSYTDLTRESSGYDEKKRSVLGYTLVSGAETPSLFSLRGENSSECFGMAYDEEEQRLYMEEKFSVSFLSNFVETESTRLVGILPSSVYVLKGGVASLPALPGDTYLRGHALDGWAYSDDILSVGASFSPTSDTELYAVFTPLTYTITYLNVKHAVGSTTTHTYMTDTLLSPLATSGYTFVAYASEETELKKDGDVFVLGGEDITSDVTLSAIWTLDAPEVTLDGYDATYDGYTHLMSPVVSHSSPDPVTCLYNWSDGGNSDCYAVRRVSDSATVTLVVTAWDGELFSPEVMLTVTVSIAPRPLKIKIKDVTQIVGRYPVSPYYEIVEGSTASADSLSTIGIVWTREEGESVGDYVLTARSDNPDYEVEFIDGIYSIVPVDSTSIIVVSVLSGAAALSLFIYVLTATLKRRKQ